MNRPLVLLYALWAGGCASAEEPARVEVPVTVDPSGMTPALTDLGYEIELSEARLVIDDLQFAIAGEEHAASLWRRMVDSLIPYAQAHPGHYQGGDVTGELRGHFILNMLAGDGPLIGVATLIVGTYQSANFTFGQAGPGDALADGDALLGHTAVFVGQASRAGSRIAFSAVLDAPPGRQLEGAPFEAEVTESSQFGVGFELLMRDDLEGKTLFDGIEFDALPRESAGSVNEGMVAILPASPRPLIVAAYDTLRRTFQTHDHFNLSAGAAR